MSKKGVENYFCDKVEEDRKYPPQRVSSLNPNQEWASHKPWSYATRSKKDPHEPDMKLHEDKKEAKIHKHKHQHKHKHEHDHDHKREHKHKHEHEHKHRHKDKKLSSMENSECHDGQRNTSQKYDEIAIEEAGLFDEKEVNKGGANGHVLASNRKPAHGSFGSQPDYSLGAEEVDTQGYHHFNVTEERCSQTQEFIPHCAFREGGLDIEEGYWYEEDEFTITNEGENEGHAPVVTHEKSTNPFSAELLFAEEEGMRHEEKNNGAQHMERQKSVATEVSPANKRDLPQSDVHRFGNKKGRWFVIGTILLIVVAVTTALALTLPSEPSKCGWDGYFGPSCDQYYPNCTVPNPQWIGNGVCDVEPYNTTECGWDGGDCACDDGYFGPYCDLHYPNCSVPIPNNIANRVCDGEPYNTEECSWDGGDCCLPGLVGPYCNITSYPNCNVSIPNWIGDGVCDGEDYASDECGWDGGDCVSCGDDYFGPNCDLYYPNCFVLFPEFIGDGFCDDEPYDTEECGWDGGDCL